jgi:FMN phosphatase YigB (HAD superfamily)
MTQSAFAELAPHTAALFGPDLYFSYQFGTKKPSPCHLQGNRTIAWRSPAEACLFVDDKPRNVAGASETGMTAFQFRGLDMLRAELARLNIAGVSS